MPCEKEETRLQALLSTTTFLRKPSWDCLALPPRVITAQDEKNAIINTAGRYST